MKVHAQRVHMYVHARANHIGFATKSLRSQSPAVRCATNYIETMMENHIWLIVCTYDTALKQVFPGRKNLLSFYWYHSLFILFI